MRRPREFPLEVPLPVGKGTQEYIFRSEYERRQAKRLVASNIPFLYEDFTMEYEGVIKNGWCNSCNSHDVAQLRMYTPDFYLVDTQIFVETKGKFDAPNRTKMKAVCQQSESDIRMVFMRDNWLTKKKKMNYSRWCEINGIHFAIGDIPIEWGKK